ncbi:MAG: acyltransferase [Wenzhouxiangella sp.]|nr:MAG: acyltransferase [Wenzhouxiangella sp.]
MPGLLLQPAARLANALAGLSRLWAWSRLRAALPGLNADCVVHACPELHGSRRIRTGRRLFLYRDIYLETEDQGLIEIGDDVVISRGVHIVAFSHVAIGAGSMIGEYASIRDANHDFRYRAGATPLRAAGHRAAPIHIGANAWIGRGAVILAGVSIGERAVIGANAVVTRSVGPGEVVGGVPARPLPGRQAT